MKTAEAEMQAEPATADATGLPRPARPGAGFCAGLSAGLSTGLAANLFSHVMETTVPVRTQNKKR
ncbi:hypothetical protein ACWC2K_15985 [Streptomyces chattanoogensis]